MKTRLLLMLIATISFQKATATVHVITAGPNNQTVFSPATLSLPLGDTIMWVWETDDHTTTSTTIPGGAAAWDTALNVTHPSFTYVPTVVGTYNYKCVPHESMGMIGSFTVTFPTSVTNVLTTADAILFPNPATREFSINIGKPANVSILDVAGRLVDHVQLISTNGYEQRYSLDRVAQGIYLLRIEASESVLLKKLQVIK